MFGRARKLLLASIAIGAIGCGGAKTDGGAAVGEAPAPDPNAPVAEPTVAEPAPPAADPIALEYQDVANKILAVAKGSKTMWPRMEAMTIGIGARLAGTKALDEAIAWAVAEMKADGHENVRTEDVMVPHWVRGEEWARITSPRAAPLRILGLGGTVATPRRGIEADVMVVSTFDELERRKAEVRGKIVLYNAVMPAYDRDKGDGYDAVYNYRNKGATRAAAHGAVAVMVRSLTTHSLSTPHTGGMNYKDANKKIPAVAVTTENADTLALMVRRQKHSRGKPVRVRIKTSGKFLPDAKSANVLGEIVGREKPDEIVLIGAHIDSWDVGQGAHDDATGCVAVMEALTVLRRLSLRPRRTIRVVLFTNEENGLRGGFAYAKAHKAEIPSHVMALESDTGGFAPRGFTVEKHPVALGHTRSIVKLLAPIKATESKDGFSGADLIPLRFSGVPSLGHWVEGDKYFDYHHTDADTLDKVDKGDMHDNVGAIAVMAYVAADMEPRFGGPYKAPPPRPPQ